MPTSLFASKFNPPSKNALFPEVVRVAHSLGAGYQLELGKRRTLT